MKPEQWQQVKAIFDVAVALPPEQQRAYLDQVCPQPDLRREVESLLQSHQQAEEFLETPAMEGFSPLPEPAPSWVGRVVGGYRIVEEIGGGGMGVIYRAEDVKLGRNVALKLLPEDMARDRESLERFLREAQTASALNHPHICTIYGVGEYEGHPFIALELLQGKTLKEVTEQGPLPTEKLLDLAIQISDALDVAHMQGIIHRDIKPSNVFVNERGQAKVLDFGLAKRAPLRLRSGEATPGRREADALELTTPGAAMGTVAYMSPEQARGEELDTRTDLFSFGALLYEMATGRRAFQGKTTAIMHDAILNRMPRSVMELNAQLPAKLDEIISKALEKDREVRYQAAADLRADLKRLKRDIESGRVLLGPVAEPSLATRVGKFLWKRWWLLAAGVVLAVLVLLAFRVTRPQHLTERDSILLTDFVNTTGETVFDGALKQALAVKLEESPFLNLVPEDRVQQTLRYMGRQVDERVTPELGRQICERQNVAAILLGSITSLGSHYVIELNAAHCRTGRKLATEQVEAESKEQVLRVVDTAASRLRTKLGESFASVERFDTPIEEATTGSLEALKAFSLGNLQRVRGSDPGSLPFYRRAVELDPNFAMAYATLGAVYANMGERRLAAENAKKAFDLRQRVSERERFYIAAHYYGDIGQFEKSVEEYEVWAQTYPRDWIPHNNLCSIYGAVGWYEKAVPHGRTAVELEPNDPLPPTSLAGVYMGLNRFEEAREVLEAFQQRYKRETGQDSDDALLHGLLYSLAFVQGDAASLERHANWSRGRAEEMYFLNLQAQASALVGKMSAARRYWKQAAEIAERYKFSEVQASLKAVEAKWLVETGFEKEGRAQALAALSINRGLYVQSLVADVLAGAGSLEQSQALGRDLEGRFPSDTLLKVIWLPLARGQIWLQQGRATEAVGALQSAQPYEMGMMWQAVPFRAIYLRGQAYLRLNRGKEAAVEFKKIIDHHGVDVLSPYRALAQLGLARAYALDGQKAEAGRAYQDFFALWRDADVDVPILQQAKREAAGLR